MKYRRLILYVVFIGLLTPGIGNSQTAASSNNTISHEKLPADGAHYETVEDDSVGLILSLSLANA